MPPGRQPERAKAARRLRVTYMAANASQAVVQALASGTLRFESSESPVRVTIRVNDVTLAGDG